MWALHLLRDPQREFLASVFLYLELVPKAIFHKRQLEQRFYEAYFARTEWCRDTEAITTLAIAECQDRGLGAIDGLHTAAAHLLRADELVTTESPRKSIHRSHLVQVTCLFPLAG